MSDLVIVQNKKQRVIACGEGSNFVSVHVETLITPGPNPVWEEVVMWDCTEWQTPGSEAFEAIMGCIMKVVSGVRVNRPTPNP